MFYEEHNLNSKEPGSAIFGNDAFVHMLKDHFSPCWSPHLQSASEALLWVPSHTEHGQWAESLLCLWIFLLRKVYLSTHFYLFLILGKGLLKTFLRLLRVRWKSLNKLSINKGAIQIPNGNSQADYPAP